jgi:ribosomal protein L40E/ribosomal protein L32
MAQDQLQRAQQLIAAGQFAEARAILQSIDHPQVAQLLAMLDQMEQTALQAQQVNEPADPPPPDDDESPADFLARLQDTVDDAEDDAPSPRRASVRTEADGTRVHDDGTYQMLWDCQYCGAKKLLGVTHRHCPNCGATQNPDARYFPAEGEYIAVTDHEYVGEDQICPSCDALNSAKAEFCGNCGAPLTAAARAKVLQSQTRRAGAQFASSGSRDITQEAFDAEMERVGVKPRKEARSGGSPWVRFGIIGIILLIIGGIATTVLWTQETDLFVTGHSWERTIRIDEYGPESDSSWCDSLPAAAYNVTRREEVRSYRQIPDGEECQTVRVDQGDGTFRQERRCQTRYREEPIYDTKCYYTIDRWDFSRTAEIGGESREDAPRWPPITLNCAGGSRIGCEKESGRSEDYVLYLRNRENDNDYQCSVEQALWQDAGIESRWTMEIGGVLGDARCNTLARAN